jgi:hypothetical protein
MPNGAHPTRVQTVPGGLLDRSGQRVDARRGVLESARSPTTVAHFPILQIPGRDSAAGQLPRIGGEQVQG